MPRFATGSTRGSTGGSIAGTRDAGDVDAVICGANGSRAGDALEAALLKRVWGSKPLPALLAPKAVLGELGPPSSST